MREDDSNWFSKWEDELPSPDELMPLSQTLITPDLALAFNIPNHHQQQPNNNNNNSSAEFDSPEPSAAAAGDEPARTLKRPRLVWTPQLHKRFVDAVAHLGIKNAVPKTIMQLMSVDGLTRENVASHLQKYRLYLKRMQTTISNGGPGPNGPAPGVDTATDRLFASQPVPAHFLHPARPGPEHFVPMFGPPPAMHHPVPHPHPHQQQHLQQFGHFGNLATNGGHFGNSPPNGVQFEHPFVRQAQMGMATMRGGSNGYVEDLESGAANGKKVLTLFPTGDD